MDWVLVYYELLIRLKTVVSPFRNLDPLAEEVIAEVISTKEVFKYPLAEILRSCRYFLSSTTLIALKSALLL